MPRGSLCVERPSSGRSSPRPSCALACERTPLERSQRSAPGRGTAPRQPDSEAASSTSRSRGEQEANVPNEHRVSGRRAKWKQPQNKSHGTSQRNAFTRPGITTAFNRKKSSAFTLPRYVARCLRNFQMSWRRSPFCAASWTWLWEFWRHFRFRSGSDSGGLHPYLVYDEPPERALTENRVLQTRHWLYYVHTVWK